MRREPGWNDTLLVAKPADPPHSGIRNPRSSQRCLLVPSKRSVDSKVRTRPELSASRPHAHSVFRLRPLSNPGGRLGPRPIDGLGSVSKRRQCWAVLADLTRICWLFDAITLSSQQLASSLFRRSSCSTPARHVVIEIPPTKYGAGEDVEEICAVSARDSLDRDFTACALGSGGGN